MTRSHLSYKTLERKLRSEDLPRRHFEDPLEEVATKSFEIACALAHYGEAYNTAIRDGPGYSVNHWA